MENSGENPALKSLKLTTTCFKDEQERLDEFAKHLIVSQEFTDTILGIQGDSGDDGSDGSDGATYIIYEFPIAIGTNVVSTGLTEDQLKRSIFSIHTTKTPDTSQYAKPAVVSSVHANGDVSVWFWNNLINALHDVFCPDNTYTLVVKELNPAAEVTSF